MKQESCWRKYWISADQLNPIDHNSADFATSDFHCFKEKNFLKNIWLKRFGKNSCVRNQINFTWEELTSYQINASGDSK